MKTFYGWKDASILDRLSVYDNYVYEANKRGDTDHMSFEEFDFFWSHRSFYYVAAIYRGE